jgi:hypothetical protein
MYIHPNLMSISKRLSQLNFEIHKTKNTSLSTRTLFFNKKIINHKYNIHPKSSGLASRKRQCVIDVAPAEFTTKP